jgi:hypothetical protein
MLPDIVGVQLEEEHKALLLDAVSIYRATGSESPERQQTLSEIILHLESDSSVVFLEEPRMRIDLRNHLDLLEIPPVRT